MPRESREVYVYGIVRTKPGQKVPAAFGIEAMGGSGPVRTIPSGRLAALVSDLARSDGGSLAEILRDDNRAKDMVLAHHRVLESMIGEYTILPLRFGAVFDDDGSVEASLEKHQDTLAQAFDRIDGALEWGLKIFCDRDVLGRSLEGETQAIQNLRMEIAEARQGRAFFLRRRMEHVTQEQVARAMDRCVEYTEERLSALVRSKADAKIQPSAVHGRSEEMVFNGAYLVARGAEGEFLGSVDSLRKVHDTYGFAYETSGPWPPYSFAACRLDGGQNAA